MLIYTDLLTGELARSNQIMPDVASLLLQLSVRMRHSGDEMIADSYEMKEVEDGFFFEVEGSVCQSS